MPAASPESSSSTQRGSRLKGHVKGLSAEEKIRYLWNSEIANRSSAPGILKVYEWHISQFTVVNAVTALHRIAKSADGATVLRDPRFTDFVEKTRELIMGPGPTR
mmetsp:Transcript_6398/g.10857  ORF Transcript_6398/g.10857 Transcript_6398/m.10857 type:complete len:105 (-) Transcript_6398:51-365(-)